MSTPEDKAKAIEGETIARAIAEKIAARVGIDTVDGTLMDHPMLAVLFMVENLLDRVELLEEVNEIKHKKGGNGDGSIQPQSY